VEVLVNRVLKCALALSLCLMMHAPSVSQNPRPDAEEKRKLLLLIENAWNQAQIARDGQALAGLITDAYVYTDYDGTVMNKAQFLADTQDPIVSPDHSDKHRCQSLSIRQCGRDHWSLPHQGKLQGQSL
jgi:hypothetical protein